MNTRHLSPISNLEIRHVLTSAKLNKELNKAFVISSLITIPQHPTYESTAHYLFSMGKAQKKTGKGRLDKYYKLAK